eukprot:1157870-Pelagomonas_calceolata.AAC.12
MPAAGILTNVGDGGRFRKDTLRCDGCALRLLWTQWANAGSDSIQLPRFVLMPAACWCNMHANPQSVNHTTLGGATCSHTPQPVSHTTLGRAMCGGAMLKYPMACQPCKAWPLDIGRQLEGKVWQALTLISSPGCHVGHPQWSQQSAVEWQGVAGTHFHQLTWRTGRSMWQSVGEAGSGGPLTLQGSQGGLSAHMPADLWGSHVGASLQSLWEPLRDLAQGRRKNY